MKKLTALLILLLFALPTYAQTADTGTVIFAAYSDTNLDGSVFTDTDAISLFAMNLTNPLAVRLGSRPNVPVLPQFSPTRTQLAFIDAANFLNVGTLTNPAVVISQSGVASADWINDGGAPRLAFRAGTTTEALYTVYAAGSGLLQLTGPNLERDLIQVSPDGRFVLFTQTVVDTNRSGAVGLPGDTNRLYKADLLTGEILAMTDGTFRVESPRWSPDGARIAYLRVTDSNHDGQYTDTDTRHLWLVNSVGGNPVQISPPEAVGAGGIVWNAIGTHLIFVHRPDLDLNGLLTPDDPQQIALVDMSTLQLTVQAQAVSISQLVSSPTGVWFAFAAVTEDTDGNGFVTPEDADALYVFNINDKSPTRVSPPGTLVTGAIAFTTGKLAFVAASQDANFDGRLTREDATVLYLVDLETALAPPEAPAAIFTRLGQIAWSPDGTKLLASVHTAQRDGVLVILNPADGTFVERTDSALRVDLSYPLAWLP